MLPHGLGEDGIATKAWVFLLESRHPDLVGQIGRMPTRKERRSWLKKAGMNRSELLRLRTKYRDTGLKSDMVAYLRFRRSLGYIEGVKVPFWLLTNGREKELRGLAGPSRIRVSSQDLVVSESEGQRVSSSGPTSDPPIPSD